MAWVYKAEHRIEEGINRPRTRQGWPTTRSGRGKAGTTISVCRYWLPGSWVRKPGGGKIQTPALTVPVLRVLLAGLINRTLKVYSPTRMLRTADRRLRRNEEARLYPWRQRKRLPLRRFDQRC